MTSCRAPRLWSVPGTACEINIHMQSVECRGCSRKSEVPGVCRAQGTRVCSMELKASGLDCGLPSAECEAQLCMEEFYIQDKLGMVRTDWKLHVKAQYENELAMNMPLVPCGMQSVKCRGWCGESGW